MRANAFLLALVSALAVTADAKSRCTVSTTDPTGDGSLIHCLERAHESTANRFLIKFHESIAGGEIDLIDAAGECITTPKVRNPNEGTFVKKVVLRGPRVPEGVPHIDIVAPNPACEDHIVLYFGEDVSVEIERLKITGGEHGIVVLGTSDSTGTDGLDESVVLKSVTVEGSTSYGVELIDIALVHIEDSKLDDCGDDGLRYSQVFGIPGGECEISLTSSEFDRNGNVETASGDGIDIRTDLVPCDIHIKSSEFDNNADDGADIDAGDGSNGNAHVTITKSEFDDNGFGEGALGNGMKADHVDVTARFSEWDNNADDGLEMIDAHFSCFKSEFDENGDDGLDLDDAIANDIKLCDFSGNAEYGIELELDVVDEISAIENIVKSTFKDNTLGAIVCNADVGVSSRSSESNESQSALAIEKAGRAGDRGKK